MRRLGSKRDDNYGIIPIALICIPLLLVLISYAVWGDIGSSEETWTDFSSEVEEVTYAAVEETVTELSDPKDDLDKEKYRVYFEDKSLVLMVLGGLEYWKMNCGTLSGTGEYFINLAIKKHDIDINEMNMDEDFQTGLFVATLYNNCSIFLFQVKTIGLGMMFTPTPEEIILDNVSEANI